MLEATVMQNKVGNVNKHVFCVKKGEYSIFFNLFNENFKNSKNLNIRNVSDFRSQCI